MIKKPRLLPILIQIQRTTKRKTTTKTKSLLQKRTNQRLKTKPPLEADPLLVNMLGGITVVPPTSNTNNLKGWTTTGANTTISG